MVESLLLWNILEGVYNWTILATYKNSVNWFYKLKSKYFLRLLKLNHLKQNFNCLLQKTRARIYVNIMVTLLQLWKILQRDSFCLVFDYFKSRISLISFINWIFSIYLWQSKFNHLKKIMIAFSLIL